MSLQLNNPVGHYGLNYSVIDYKIFPEDDRYSNAPTLHMPLLIGEGRTPLSAADLMKRRVEVLEMLLSAARGSKYEHFSDLERNPKTAPYYELLVNWFDNYVATGDGAARHSDGRMKVAPAAQYLRSLTPRKLECGAVPLTNSDFAGLDGVEFSQADVDKYCGKPLSINGVKKNPVWLALADGDKALLSEYANATLALTRKMFGHKDKMMEVFAPRVPDKGAAGRLWTLYSLGGGFIHSGASGDSHLNYGLGRLVGEAQLVRSTLEQTLNVP